MASIRMFRWSLMRTVTGVAGKKKGAGCHTQGGGGAGRLLRLEFFHQDCEVKLQTLAKKHFLSHFLATFDLFFEQKFQCNSFRLSPVGSSCTQLYISRPLGHPGWSCWLSWSPPGVVVRLRNPCSYAGTHTQRKGYGREQAGFGGGNPSCAHRVLQSGP